MDKFETALREIKELLQQSVAAGAVQASPVVEHLGRVDREYHKAVLKLKEAALLLAIREQLMEASEFDGIGQLAVGTAMDRCSAERGFILIQARTGGHVHQVVSRGIADDERATGPSTRVVKWVLEHNETVLTPFIQGDARFVQADGESATMADRPREVLAVPIPGGSAPQGVLYLDRLSQPGAAPFSEDAIKFLKKLVVAVGQVVAKVNLIDSLKVQVAAKPTSAFAALDDASIEVELADRMKLLLELRAETAAVVQRLLKRRLVKIADLETAFTISRKQNISITRALMENGALSSKDYIRFCQEEMRIAAVNLSNYVIDVRLLSQVPKEICERYVIIPLLRVDQWMSVAMMDPLDPFILDNLSRTTGLEIRPMVAPVEEIRRTIQAYFDKAHERDAAKEAPEERQDGFMDLVNRCNRVLGAIRRKEGSGAKASETSMLELVLVVLESGVRLLASDVHVQPEESTLRIRYRIDGLLHTVMDVEKRYTDSFVSALKIMAKVDIAEKRLPQDGKAVLEVDARKVDLRLSTLPGANGEKVVVRILDRKAVNFDLDMLGFEPDILTTFRQQITRPNGLVLVTGPTGSGKTTTLYGVLNILNMADSNLLTLEDPIEFTLEGVTQTQVAPRIGLDFATGLRSMMRQDPDVIMVGEVRDPETAETTVRAALTGHMVFSTLHTNDAAGAVTRLIDLGINGFMVGEALTCVLAQRLVRVVCQHCRTSSAPSALLADRLQLQGNDRQFAFPRSQGCISCNQTGYRGRSGIYELLMMSNELRRLIFSSKDPDQIRTLCLTQGMRTLRGDGIIKSRRGLTSLEEVLACTGGV